MRTLTAALAASLALAPGCALATAPADPTSTLAATTSRLAGSDRYETAAAISRSTWTPATAQHVYLTSGTSVVDAMTAGSLTDGPILLASPTGIPAATAAEIARLGHPPVLVIGGVLPDAVARTAGATGTRLAGTSRIETSVAISRYGFASAPVVYLAPASGPDGGPSPDAVVGGALSGGPILLVEPTAGPSAAVRAEIARLGATRIVQLGRRSLSWPTTGVLGGVDRYATSVTIAETVPGDTVHLANGQAFADAAAAGSLTDGPTVLTSSTALPASVCDFLARRRPTRVVALGSTGVVPDTILTKALSCANHTLPQPDPGAVAALQLTHDFAAPTKATSIAQLSRLAVTAPGPMTGYSRTLFPHWRDASTWGWPVAPSNACDSRNAALFRDGVDVTISSSCTVQSGRWLDPYTATWLTTKADVDIDHLVPLAAAWRSGASSWTTARRTAYANDRLVLVSVDASANRSKGDKTADLWKPPNVAARCLYAQRYTAVKSTYGLSVSAPEKTALATMLDGCR